MREKMLAYLQEMLNEFCAYRKQFGDDDSYVEELYDQMIGCKEMVEFLIQEPVNLRKDGKVTVGLDG